MSNINLNIQFSAELTEAAISQILIKALEKEFGKSVKAITYNMREVSDPTDRYSHKVFSGCKVTFDPRPVDTSNQFER
jgi:hypothetical protein